MADDPAWFPSVHEYALARRCSTCGAQPGQPCDAPRKQGAVEQRDRVRAQVGAEPLPTDPLHLMHAQRFDAGSRHYDRDVQKAPWPEDREPGRRYDTLGDLRKMPDGS